MNELNVLSIINSLTVISVGVFLAIQFLSFKERMVQLITKLETLLVVYGKDIEDHERRIRVLEVK